MLKEGTGVERDIIAGLGFELKRVDKAEAVSNNLPLKVKFLFIIIITNVLILFIVTKSFGVLIPAIQIFLEISGCIFERNWPK